MPTFEDGLHLSPVDVLAHRELFHRRAALPLRIGHAYWYW
jgi:hypothetical protein